MDFALGEPRSDHRGNQARGAGEPPPPGHTIRFSILIVRTPKASLVEEKSTTFWDRFSEASGRVSGTPDPPKLSSRVHETLIF